MTLANYLGTLPDDQRHTIAGPLSRLMWETGDGSMVPAHEHLAANVDRVRVNACEVKGKRVVVLGEGTSIADRQLLSFVKWLKEQ